MKRVASAAGSLVVAIELLFLAVCATAQPKPEATPPSALPEFFESDDFVVALFIYTDFVGARIALTWDELRDLAREGFDIQAHSKTHGDLRRKPGESEDDYTRRLDAELLQRQALFRRHLGEAKPILAYPYGSHDEEILKRLRDAGYWAALDVRRQGNPAFTPLLTIHRAQIYADMTIEQFARNLTVFAEEAIR